MSEFPTDAGERLGQSGEFQKTAQHARSAAGEVAGTAKEQTQAVVGEAKEQARQMVGRLRGQAGEQVHHQSRRAAQGIRQWADDLSSMSEGGKPDSPVSGVVQQVADGGRRVADYLEQHGLAGAVDEVQSFARRRPGAFLAGAAAMGFLIGRIAKASGGSASTTASTGPTTGASPIPAQPLQSPVEPPFRAQPLTPEEEFGGAAAPPGGMGGEVR
jgi:hypothetical protein